MEQKMKDPKMRDGKGEGVQAQRLAKLNTRLLTERRAGEDVPLTLRYRGEERVVHIPARAIDSYCNAGGIPDPNTAVEAVRLLEDAKTRIATGVGKVNPLEITAHRLFGDAQGTHLLNVIYAHEGSDRVCIREDFKADFDLERLDPIAREIAAAVLNTTPEMVRGGRSSSVFHKVGTRVIDLGGLGVTGADHTGEVEQLVRRGSASHIEWVTEKRQVEATLISIGAGRVQVETTGSGNLGELFSRALEVVPRDTVERYGADIVRQAITTYVNAEYLVPEGRKIELEVVR